MKCDTVGNQIRELIQNCRCGLTGGCNECNPILFQSKQLSERLTNPFYGKNILDKQLAEMAKNASGIERVHEITNKIPQKIWDECKR